jgi:hypothetical protein
MNDYEAHQGNKGLYLGTERAGKWWRRFLKKGFFARGNGRYWHDQRAFYFQRHLTKTPLTIPFERMVDIKVGTWHSGRWIWGYPIIKIVWEDEGEPLSSGFSISKSSDETNDLVNVLIERMNKGGVA